MHARVVHQHVEPAVGFHDSGDRRFPRFGIGHFEVDHLAAPGVFGPEDLRLPAIDGERADD